jgi:hypothetical protein
MAAKTMDRDGRYEHLPATLEAVCARRNWEYQTASRVMRTGMVGQPGTKQRAIAEGLAAEMGLPFEVAFPGVAA